MLSRLKMKISPTALAVLLVALGLSSGAAAQTPDESKLKEHKHYTNKAGQDVHSPAHSTDGSVPKGATAKCRDGTYSFSKTHRGTCSGHGGVAQWLG